jgi:hypothetical protein
VQREQVQRRSHRLDAAQRYDEAAFLLRHLEIRSELDLRFTTAAFLPGTAETGADPAETGRKGLR